MDNQTLFMVGCARTGSTLLRQILNRSEHVCIAPETHFLRRMSSIGMRKQIARFGDLSADANVVRLVDFMYSDQHTPTTGYWGWLKRNVDQLSFTQRLLRSDRSDRAIFTVMLRLYALKQRGAHDDALIIGEKTPTHLYYVPTLFEWFPETKVIHTFRDPRGIFVSTLKRIQEGRWGLKAHYPAIPDWLNNPLNRPLATLFTTKTWFDAARLHSLYQRQYRDNYLLVRFEDLIADPEMQIERICAFLRVPVEPRMLDEVVVVSSSYRAQRRGPRGFDPQAINRWQHHIDPLVRLWFSTLGRRQLKDFGYLP
jgi:hypothetical protein